MYQTDDQKWEDDLTEDKQRRVRHELEPGDVIQEVRNVTRVTGVDASRQFLLLCCTKTRLTLLQLVFSYSERRICICLMVYWCGRTERLLKLRMPRRISSWCRVLSSSSMVYSVLSVGECFTSPIMNIVRSPLFQADRSDRRIQQTYLSVPRRCVCHLPSDLEGLLITQCQA